MNVRPAEAGDHEAIHAVADRSLQASYSLSPDQISTVLEEEFSPAALEARSDDESRLLVADDGSAVLGFADVHLGTGTLRWVHVDPGERGDGVGTALVERARSDVEDAEAQFSALVLDEASEGSGFLERFGLHRSETRDTEFGRQELSAHVYTDSAENVEANEPAVTVPEHVVEAGAERPLDRDEPIPGTESPFFVTYTGGSPAERYGFFCSSCGSTDVAADDLDRLECGNCGNRHRADEWDDAYL